MDNKLKTMDKIVSLCKNRGFIFPGSEIYGGLANSWDYGPLGVEFKNNVKKAWWKKFVQENKYNVGLDAAILMNPQTWVASGHLAGFSDPMMDCRECHERFRADKLIEDWCEETGFTLAKPIDAFSQAELKEFVDSLPEKENTNVGDRGARLSGGQRQRLCIARALLKKPKILILDDSTSAVDTHTDAMIRKAFREEIPGTTKLIIAQRIASVQDADMIIMMDNGQISDVGSHDELMQRSSIYQEVFYSQQKGGEE